MTTVFKNKLVTNLVGTTTTLSVTTITPSSPTSGSVTLGFATQPAIPYAIGTNIYVSGISVAGYNGSFVVTGATTSSVTVTNATTTGSATGGSIVNNIFQSSSSATTTVIGFSLTNTTSELSQATVRLQDTLVGTTAYYISNAIVPAYQSLRIVTGGEKLVLTPSTNVFITSSIPTSLDVVMSWVEIS